MYKLVLRHVSASVLSHLHGALVFFSKQVAHIEKKRQLPEVGEELRLKHIEVIMNK